MAITIYDVAREANVSMATVSRVLNGNPNVKPDTRRRVKEVIKRLNYKPNAVARGLASKKTKTIGVIIPDVSDLYYSAILKGLEDISEMYQYQIIISNTDNDGNKELKAFETLSSNQVDGIILLGGSLDEATHEVIEQYDNPIVMCGYSKRETMSTVNINYPDAIGEVVRGMIDRGRKQFVYVKSGYHSFLEDALGERIQKELEENGVNTKVDTYNAVTYEEGIELYERLVGSDVDAVISISDEVAGGILHGTLDHNVEVPKDLEVLSCSNTRIAYMMRPQLSTIAVPLYDIGAVGMRLLTKLMNKEETEITHVELPYKINYSETTL
ncbi:LacI family DNA-binding transcriptional regulator [Phocicoccus pinnipedialis]|uniref:Catabolite control protein A n=1 Tax=Phocicoccus pinnipedialis TaxID=110845 RepID=A0A6V7RCL5_9BACL|nr:substrate-binding domain-containing protein [Jeotgalicoccus pinnipedialis]MBP1939541.1 LacI family transcriptional regulator [Jeotgalicoccus pinnipedialis]CAD2074989.1 Catabolite control protein A [Jeotgalicoccus pinnipedialis]